MTEIANQAIGRRSFLKGLALAGVGAAGVASLGGCATPLSDTGNSSAAFDFAQTINWDGQYDVVVVGFGSAGAVTAMSAAEAGASVLLLDKAPLGHEGGNSRYCGQTFMHSNGDEQAARDYFVAMCGSMPWRMTSSTRSPRASPLCLKTTRNGTTSTSRTSAPSTS